MTTPIPGNETASELTAKKKTRLNPARRKAAKAKTDASKPEAQRTGTGGEAQSLKSPERPSAPPVPRATSSTDKPALPPALSRQNTEPLPSSLLKQMTTPPPASRKPNLLRTVTAPASSKKSKSLTLTAPAVVTGGLVGCAAGAAILLGVGIWYDFSGPESAILAAKSAKLCVDNFTEELITSLKAGTYSADEALDINRRTTLAYASTIPGGAPFVERVFREIDMVRKQRGREIDNVVAETYAELSKVGNRGASSTEMRTIVVGQLMKLSKFAAGATQDVVIRNPNLSPYRDGAVRSLSEPKATGVPTMRVNMAVRQKQAVNG